MPQELYNMYNSLSVARKQEVYDFVMFLSDKDMPKRKSRVKVDLKSDKLETVEDFFRFMENAPHVENPEPWTRDDLHDNRGL